MMWMLIFTAYGAVRVSGNFFGTAATHRCLPPLLAMVTSWLVAVPDLVTGDLHGLSLTLGIVFILGAPVTVTAIALLEMGRLKRRYGIRLKAHPATLAPTPTPTPTPAPAPGPVPPMPPGMPPAGPPYLPPQGNPYGHPYAPGGRHSYGQPYAPGGQHPYAPQPPYNPQHSYGG
jgi:hypothetical protein